MTINHPKDLSPSETAIVDRLRDAGFRTVYVGHFISTGARHVVAYDHADGKPAVSVPLKPRRRRSLRPGGRRHHVLRLRRKR